MSVFAKLEDAFVRVMGRDAIRALKQLKSPVNILTIGGDQLTGKSTLSKAIAAELQGAYISAGTLFRLTAKEKGVTVAELSRAAQNDKDIDVRIEYATCKTIMGGAIEGLGPSHPTIIIEGRNPAVMAAYCRSILGKTNIISIYLSCTPRMQARRFFKREIGEHYLPIFDKAIKREFPNLHEVGSALNILTQHNETSESQLVVPSLNTTLSLSTAIQLFVDNADRDGSDRQRFLSLYSLPTYLDYRYKGLYDLVIDTTDQTPDDTLIECLEALRFFPEGRSMLFAAGLIPSLSTPSQGLLATGVDEPLTTRIRDYCAIRLPPAVDLPKVRGLALKAVESRRAELGKSQL